MKNKDGKPQTSRYKSRVLSLQLLYQFELTNQTVLLNEKDLSFIRDEVRLHCDYFQVPAKLHEFCYELVLGTLTNITQLDQWIGKVIKKWQVNRMSPIDRSIIRLAAYEMLLGQKTPPAIVINEAIEMGKQFSGENSAAFINGVLDALKVNLIK